MKHFKIILKRRSCGVKWMWEGNMYGIVLWDFYESDANYAKTISIRKSALARWRM